MPETANIPYDWLQTIKPDLLKHDSIPLLGYPPAFPWSEISDTLSKRLEVEDLSISPGEISWRSSEQLFEGMNEPLSPLSFGISGIDGTLTWLFSESDLSFLMDFLITKDPTLTLSSIDEEIREGFFQFVALETIHTISNLPFGQSLTIRILPNRLLPSTDALCLDVILSLGEKTVVGRLAISPDFRKAWAAHYSKKQEKQAIASALSEQLTVTVDLQVGRTVIPLKTWHTLTPGDFVLLDECLIAPGEKEGRVLLTLKGKPLYNGEWKDGNIKILETVIYQEAGAPMEQIESPEEHEDEEELTPPPFEDELEDEDFGLDFEDEEEDTFDEELEEETFDEEEHEEEHEEEITAVEEPLEDAAVEEEKPAVEEPVEEAPAATIAATAAKKEKPVAKEDLPLTLAIEVGRIQIPVKQLMELQPGNLLELNVKPENGVDLVINGRYVGKAELLRVGDALGVRILEIA